MRDRVVETFRTVLTVTGLVLLIVFGSRAAGQAQNRQLAGATHRSSFNFAALAPTSTPGVIFYGTEAVHTVSKVVAAHNAEAAAPQTTQTTTTSADTSVTTDTVQAQTDATVTPATDVTIPSQLDQSQTDKAKVDAHESNHAQSSGDSAQLSGNANAQDHSQGQNQSGQSASAPGQGKKIED